MIKNRYYKSLLGSFAQIAIAKAVAYTDDASYKLFCSNAAVGEIGVFNNLTGASYLAVGGAIPAGTEIFIAQKRAKSIWKSTPFKLTTELVASKLAYSAPAKQVVTVATTAGATIATNDLLEVLVVETTPGKEPAPRYSYNVVVKAGETLTQAITRLVAQITSDNLGSNAVVVDPIVNAAVTNVDDFTLTAKEFGQHFSVALRGRLAEIATFSTTTKFAQGQGTSTAIAELEKIGYINQGVTTNYPNEGNPSEYGQPETFTVDGTTYTLFAFKGNVSQNTPLPVNVQTQNQAIYIAAPAGVAPATELATLFGV